MGCHFWAHIATWTFLCSVKVSLGDQNLEQGLDLNAFLDVTKVNISQDEYTRMMTTYLNRLRDSIDNSSVPELRTFDAEIKTWHKRKKCITRMEFPNLMINPKSDVEQAEVRVLVSPFEALEYPVIQIYQILGARRHRLLEERKIYPSTIASKWFEFEVTSAIKVRSKADSTLILELHCSQCNASALQPLQATLSILVHSHQRRVRRSSPYNNERSQSDCEKKSSKQLCCLHKMKVVFRDLKIPQVNSIVQPKFYEAGFCKGRCPYNYNHATNHSRIQSLVHKIDRKAVPRVCCAPFKLAPLDILRVDPYDFTKLAVEKWENMQVVECACS